MGRMKESRRGNISLVSGPFRIREAKGRQEGDSEP